MPRGRSRSPVKKKMKDGVLVRYSRYWCRYAQSGRHGEGRPFNRWLFKLLVVFRVLHVLGGARPGRPQVRGLLHLVGEWSVERLDLHAYTLHFTANPASGVADAVGRLDGPASAAPSRGPANLYINEGLDGGVKIY